MLIARTGYSGELGYELFFPREYAEGIWDAAFAAGEPFGIVPCGLGALRSVRMEKKYPLYGLDLNDTTSPLEAGVGWTVRFETGAFIGRDALARQRDAGVTRRLVGIAFDGVGYVPKAGDVVTVDGRPVGSITSSDTGHYLGRALAMGYLEPAAADRRHERDRQHGRDGRSRAGASSTRRRSTTRSGCASEPDLSWRLGGPASPVGRCDAH